MSILVDATVVSNFAAIQQLELLARLYGTVFIANSVYEELQIGFEEGYFFLANLERFVYPFTETGWLHLVNLESQVEVGFYQKIPSKLHRGEAISLAIAKYRHWLFLTDDKGARRFAKQNGIAVSGTLGVLIGLIEGEIVTLLEANEMLAGMITLARYQSPITDLGLLLAD